MVGVVSPRHKAAAQGRFQTSLPPAFFPEEEHITEQKPGWLQGQPCPVSSESTDEEHKNKTYFSNLSWGLLGLEVPFGNEGTEKGLVTSPADPWKKTQSGNKAE